VDGDTFTLVVNLIREFGFPVVFCLWLMKQYSRREDKMIAAQDKMIAAQDKVVEVLEQVNDKLEHVAEVQDELSGRHEVGALLLPEPKKPAGGAK
jgi:hypothetical protein